MCKIQRHMKKHPDVQEALKKNVFYVIEEATELTSEQSKCLDRICNSIQNSRGEKVEKADNFWFQWREEHPNG